MTRARLLAASVLWYLAGAFSPAITFAQRSNDDLSNVSLEPLTQKNIRVSLFARKDEDLWTTPAAVFVITEEDIARSSASSVPEVLRMVPGTQVAQIDASSWAISACVFNSAFADKLLVLNWITTSGDVYGVHINQQIEPDITLNVRPRQQETGSPARGHILGLWEQTLQRGEMAPQVDCDEQSRHVLATHFRTRTLNVSRHLDGGCRVGMREG